MSEFAFTFISQKSTAYFKLIQSAPCFFSLYYLSTPFTDTFRILKLYLSFSPSTGSSYRSSSNFAAWPFTQRLNRYNQSCRIHPHSCFESRSVLSQLLLATIQTLIYYHLMLERRGSVPKPGVRKEREVGSLPHRCKDLRTQFLQAEGSRTVVSWFTSMIYPTRFVR